MATLTPAPLTRPLPRDRFVDKLVQILQTSDPTIVHWNSDGTSFIVSDLKRCVHPSVSRAFKAAAPTRRLPLPHLLRTGARGLRRRV